MRRRRARTEHQRLDWEQQHTARELYKCLTNPQKRQMESLLIGKYADVGLGGAAVLTRIILEAQEKRARAKKSRT